VSQRFIQLIRNGETAEVAAAAEETPSLIASRDAQGVSAFLWSIYSQQPLIRDFLYAHLLELDIFEAAAMGDCARIEALLEHDPKILQQTSPDGWSPLHLAAAFGGPAATSLLLQAAADVNQRSSNPLQNQPLHACIALGKDRQTARVLIAAGAEINSQQAGGYTPLHQAAAAGLTEMTELLLEAGADPTLPCMQGKTPLDYARERQHNAVLQLLTRA
jgi:ankyrin repeat protein